MRFFKNIGKKIKKLATICFFVIAVLGILLGLFMIIEGNTKGERIAGLINALVIPFSAWIGSFVMYGFGELIDHTMENTKILKQISAKLSNTDINNEEPDGAAVLEKKLIEEQEENDEEAEFYNPLK